MVRAGQNLGLNKKKINPFFFFGLYITIFKTKYYYSILHYYSIFIIIQYRIDNGGLNRKKSKNQLFFLSSLSTCSTKIIRDIWIFFFPQLCKIFFCIKAKLSFLKGNFFLRKRFLVSHTLPTAHSGFFRGWNLWFIHPAEFKWRNRAEEGWGGW